MLLLIGKGTTCLVVRKINSPSILPSCILHAGILFKKNIVAAVCIFWKCVWFGVYRFEVVEGSSRATEVAACQSGFILKMKA